ETADCVWTPIPRSTTLGHRTSSRPIVRWQSTQSTLLTTQYAARGWDLERSPSVVTSPFIALMAPAHRLSRRLWRAALLASLAVLSVLLSACSGAAVTAQPTTTAGPRTQSTVYYIAQPNGSGNTTGAPQGSLAGTLIALDGASGTQLWSASLTGPGQLVASP